MPKHDEYHPGPLQGISPEGLPGLFTVAFVLFGFTTLFVSRGAAEVLLWVMVGVVLSATGVTLYRSIKSGPTSHSGTLSLVADRGLSVDRCGRAGHFRAFALCRVGRPGGDRWRWGAADLALATAAHLSVRPNPRLQRTRSALPPSPLSRQPLGGAG